MSADEIRRKIQRVETERTRRSVAFYASAALIIPTWLAVLWFLPNLRIVAAIGLATAFWILYQVHRRSAARLMSVDLATGASLEFYRSLLERELAFYRGLPLWFLPPVVLSTSAIIVGFLANPGFEHTPVFFAVLASIGTGTAVALVIGVRNSRRKAALCQQELDALTP